MKKMYPQILKGINKPSPLWLWKRNPNSRPLVFVKQRSEKAFTTSLQNSQILVQMTIVNSISVLCVICMFSLQQRDDSMQMGKNTDIN